MNLQNFKKIGLISITFFILVGIINAFNPEINKVFTGDNNMRVKLSYEGQEVSIKALNSFSETLNISSNHGNIFFRKIFGDTDSVEIKAKGNLVCLKGWFGFCKKTGESLQVFTNKKKTGIVEITSWDRTPSWDKNNVYNDNKFEGALDIKSINGKLIIVNELPLESYIKGIAETPESDGNEKRKALTILARSYAKFYTLKRNNKFGNNFYDGSDNPSEFQKYLGYGFISRSPNWQKAVIETKGQVLYFNGEVFKAPFSSCTSTKDKKRRLPQEAGWSQQYFIDTFPVFKKVDDSIGYEEGRNCGHGVGFSGKGATELGIRGYKFNEIINYYFNNLKIKKYSSI